MRLTLNVNKRSAGHCYAGNSVLDVLLVENAPEKSSCHCVLHSFLPLASRPVRMHQPLLQLLTFGAALFALVQV